MTGPVVTEALVLKRYDFGETSQTARLFTRSHGRLAVLAKGIKRGGADLRGPMDLLALAEVEIRLRPRSDLHLLVRYRVVTGFPGLRRNLDRLWAGFYATEILREGTRDEDPAPELFDLARGTLGALETAGSDDVPRVITWFELRFLAATGFLPRFGHCVRCGKAAPSTGPVRFSPVRGGLICSACAATSANTLVTLSLGTRAVLAQFLAASSPGEARAVAWTVEQRKTVRRLLPRVLEVVLERELRAVEFLGD